MPHLRHRETEMAEEVQPLKYQDYFEKKACPKAEFRKNGNFIQHRYNR